MASLRPRALAALRHPPSLRPAIHAHALSTKPPSATPAFEQLSRLRDLIRRVGRTNRPQEKQAILAEYPDLRGLLEHVYDPHIKHHVTSAKLAKAKNEAIPPSAPAPPTLSELLEALSTRQVTGNTAIDAIQSFLVANNIPTSDEQQPDGDGLSVREVFLRVLDKNLKAGIAGKTLEAVRWGDGQVEAGNERRKACGAISAEPVSITSDDHQQPLTDPPPPPSRLPSTDPEPELHTLPPPTRIPHFSCALGKTVLRADLARILSLPPHASDPAPSPTPPKWLASRKLDGVRLLVVLDIFIPDPAGSEDPNNVQVRGIWTLSRSGKEYHSLDILKQQLSETLSAWPGLLTLLASEPRYPSPSADGSIARLVLDGELCHLNDAASAAGADPTEDFMQIVSMVRRKGYTIARPAMFLLDVLPWSVFLSGMEKGSGAAGDYKVFAERVKDCEAVVDRVEAGGGGSFPVLRRLEQRVVGSIEEVEDMIGVAAERGWEGLVLRRGDQPYEGKRSSSILKYKEWQDGEYVALGIDVNTMRLPVDGVFAERKALANVWIEHKGTKVSVGSGFSADERLRYAEDPSLLIGKEMTIEYFAESTAANRGGSGGAVSLRFPRVKKVWERGKRDV